MNASVQIVVSLLRSAVVAGLGVVAFVAAPLAAQSVHDVPTATGSGVRIQVSTPLRFAPHFGFIPVLVAIDNQSGAEGTWDVAITSGDANVFPGLARASFQVRVAAGASQESWLYAPLATPGIVATPVIDGNTDAPLSALPPGNPSTTPAPGANAASGSEAEAALRAEATAVLEPTRLLDTPWGVRESISTVGDVVLFEQTGSAWALGKPPAASLPPGVLVNLHPAIVPEEVVRTITYVGQATLAELDATPVSRVDAYRKAVARNTMALRRYGYLREGSAIQVSTPSSFGDRDGVVTVSVNETGPASLLAQPVPEAMPPNTLVTILPAPVPPGGVTRKFTVTTLVPAVSDNPGAARPFSAVLGAADPGLIQAEISGPGLDRPVATDLSAGLDGEIQPMPPISVPAALEGIIRERLALGNLRAAPTVTAIDPSTLPADWRLWSSMHAIVLQRAEYDRLDADHKTSLRQWVAMGGRLVLTTNSDETGPSTRLGAGDITVWSGALAYTAPSEASRNLQLASPVIGLPAREALARDNASVERFGSGERSDTGWLNYVLIAFAVVAGPVNLLFFAPPGRRHRMLFTMPVIALAGAIVMGIGLVVRVGLGGEGVRTTVISVLPGGEGAAVFQDQVSHTGLIASRRFDLPQDAIVAAAPLDAGGTIPGATQLDRSGDGAAGDWFRSRGYQAYHLRRFVPFEGRVEVSVPSGGGAPTVTSSLPGALNDFSWVDADNRVWTAASVVPGERMTLAPAAEGAWPSLAPGGSRALGVIQAAAASRMPGRWIARGNGEGFPVIPTLASIRWLESNVLISGIATPAVPPRPL
jgi:hypothetical protein